MSEAALALESVQKLTAIALEQEQKIASQNYEIESLRAKVAALEALVSPSPIPPAAEQPVRVVTGVSVEDEPE
jgi:hypothetical protein